jgi:hypothetical protein
MDSLKIQAFLLRSIGVAVLASLLAFPLSGDDGHASVGAGGITLTKESRILMKKEKLSIGMQKVSVEFEFLNESATGISTDVAFPIPAYQWPYLGSERIPNFPDFRVWVDGVEIKYSTELRATRNGHDYSALLQQMGINIETFGDFDVYEGGAQKPNQFLHLASPQLEQLRANGLVDLQKDGSYTPHWGVSKMYYWAQSFPAGKVVHIRHEYTPVSGAAEIPAEYFNQKYRIRKVQPTNSNASGEEYAKNIAESIENACTDLTLQKRLSTHNRSGLVFMDYVNYVLVSANTWKTPIRQFELVVDKTNAWGKEPVFVSFCWDGPVDQIDPTHFSARKTDFIPTKDIAIYFFRK